MWHSHNCIGQYIHALTPHWAFLMTCKCNDPPTSFDSRNTLCLSLQMGSFIIQEDPFLAYYSTMLNNALTGSIADITLSPVATFIRLDIANIATNSQCDIMPNMYHTLFNLWLPSQSWLETPATEILFAKVQVWWPKQHQLIRTQWYLLPVFCDNTMTAWCDTRCVPSRYNYIFISYTRVLDINLSTKYYTLDSDEERWYLYINASMRSTNTFCLPIGLKYSPGNAKPSWKISYWVGMRLMFVLMMLESFPHHR